MQSKTLKQILVVTALISVSGYLLNRYWEYFVVGILYLMIPIIRIGSPPPVPSDELMYSHFTKNEQSFNRLLYLKSLSVLDWEISNPDDLFYRPDDKIFRSFLEDNPLYYYSLLPVREENNDIHFLTPVEREKECKRLMKKLKIKSCEGIHPVRTNSILFIYFHDGHIYKGFEYVFDRTKEDSKKFYMKKEEELYWERPRGNTTKGLLYKKMDDHWNLFIIL